MDNVVKRLSLGIGVVLWMSCCSVLLDVDGKQCRNDIDCVDTGLGDRCVEDVCVGEARVACTSNSECSDTTPVCMANACQSVENSFYCEPEPPSEASTVKYSFAVTDFANRESIPQNIVARACPPADYYCDEPVDIYQDTAGTGQVVLSAPKGVPVYFLVTGEGHLTAALYDSGTTSNPNVDRVLGTVLLATTEFVVGGAAAQMIDYDPLTDGVVWAQLFDCSGTPASGVEFTKPESKGTPVVLRDYIASVDSTLTQYDPVYNQAYGGFIGVSARVLEMRARWNGEALTRGSSETLVSVAVREGAFTYVNLRLYRE